jgi:hypothetical protein
MQKQEAKNAQKELVSKIIPVLGEIAGKNNSNNDRVVQQGVTEQNAWRVAKYISIRMTRSL